MPTKETDRLASKNARPSTAMNHLRSRLHIAIPVFVYGCEGQGNPFQETTETLSVNPGGGLIGLETPVEKGQKLFLVNLETEETVLCSVLNIRPNKIGKPLVGLAFNQSSPRYWGSCIRSRGERLPSA
jgi:hypothetical protein